MSLLAGWSVHAIVLSVVLVALFIYAVGFEPHHLEVVHTEARIRDLPPGFDGYTISVLADFHQTPGDTLNTVRRAVKMALDAEPDLIVMLGDYGPSAKTTPRLSRWLYARSMRALTPVLTPLHARDGVLAVVGNHDYYGGMEYTRRWLESLGVRVLLNDAVRIQRGGETLVVGGVEDPLEGTPDPNGGIDPDTSSNREPTIVLSHNPDGILHLNPKRRIDLVLSGHTHGGQVVIPFFGAPITSSRVCRWRHASGWVPNDRVPLYVSRGVGTQTPVRFNCRPEVTILRLRNA